MKVWITKYALTDGIYAVEAQATHSERMVVFTRGESGNTQYAHGHDWHKTQESALARAEEIRAKRIKSLKKSLAELEKMEFKA